MDGLIEAMLGNSILQTGSMVIDQVQLHQDEPARWLVTPCILLFSTSCCKQGLLRCLMQSNLLGIR